MKYTILYASQDNGQFKNIPWQTWREVDTLEEAKHSFEMAKIADDPFTGKPIIAVCIVTNDIDKPKFLWDNRDKSSWILPCALDTLIAKNDIHIQGG
jgi:hypothetical protein